MSCYSVRLRVAGYPYVALCFLARGHLAMSVDAEAAPMDI